MDVVPANRPLDFANYSVDGQIFTCKIEYVIG